MNQQRATGYNHRHNPAPSHARKWIRSSNARATKLRTATALVVIIALSSGCASQIKPLPPTTQPSPHPPPTFGIVVWDAGGMPRLFPTNEVPNIVEQQYGWKIWVGASTTPVAWTERITLPRPPATWNDAGAEPNISISPDGCTAITQGASVPENGFIASGWSIAEGDPPGNYEFVVTIADNISETFTFTVGEPQEPATPPTSWNQTVALQACEKIQETAGVSISCEFGFLEGTSSMAVSFSDFAGLHDHWEPIVNLVATPFCDAAELAGEQAHIYVIIGELAAGRYRCESEVWSGWIEFDSMSVALL